MANFLDKLKVPTAIRKHTKLDLSHTHITTGNFMEANIPMIRYNIPKEKLSVDINAFARLDYMILPSLGHVRHNMHAFFVPFRTVMPAFNDFITNSPHVFPNADSTTVGEIITSTPTVSNMNLVSYLITVSAPGNSTDFDFAVFSGTSTTASYYKLTDIGRRSLKILNQLGYKPQFDVRTSSDGNSQTFSALALLAYVKVYCDWFFPSAYNGDAEYLYLASLCKHDSSTPFSLSVTDLELIFKWTTYVQYDSDYFTSAFDNPVGPNSGGDSVDIQISDVTLPSTTAQSRVRQANNSTPIINGVSTGGASTTNATNLSQFALMTLHRVSDYLQRHRLAGARSLERYLARFGVTLDSDKLDRSYYLGSHSINLEVSDIMGTADTINVSGQGGYIGQYAGKGIMRGNNAHFECSSDEFGLFIVVSSIVPQVGYPQGIDRHILNKDRLSFFTPEFDGYGCQPIVKGELIVPVTDNTEFKNPFTGVFGFTGRYAEYKVAKDKLSGDFVLRTHQSSHMSSPAFHMMRLFSDNMESVDAVHSLAFARGNDAFQYNRIFYPSVAIGTADHFTIQYLINASAKAPCSSLFDIFEFDEEEGRNVSLEANGVRVN